MSGYPYLLSFVPLKLSFVQLLSDTQHDFLEIYQMHRNCTVKISATFIALPAPEQGKNSYRQFSFSVTVHDVVYANNWTGMLGKELKIIITQINKWINKRKTSSLNHFIWTFPHHHSLIPSDYIQSAAVFRPLNEVSTKFFSFEIGNESKSDESESPQYVENNWSSMDMMHPRITLPADVDFSRTQLQLTHVEPVITCSRIIRWSHEHASFHNRTQGKQLIYFLEFLMFRKVSSLSMSSASLENIYFANGPVLSTNDFSKFSSKLGNRLGSSRADRLSIDTTLANKRGGRCSDREIVQNLWVVKLHK